MNRRVKLALALLLTLIMVFLSACQSPKGNQDQSSGEPQQSSSEASKEDSSEEAKQDSSEVTPPENSEATEEASEASGAADSNENAEESGQEETEEPVEKNGEIYILFTSDVHCGIDQGFGYAGLWQIRQALENQGYTTILVDDGDAVQGEPIGTLTYGEAIIELMNAMQYDVAIPGNHEFDYGMDQFLKLAELANFPYVSCNFMKDGEPVFDPYVIKDVCGHKIAFIGVTTPKTFTSSTPRYFQDEEGNFVYGFSQDESGEGVYQAVQSAIDSAREEGAELVYVMGHVGLEAECEPWTYADIIANTSGIDVFLDGHSHDTEQVSMTDKEGRTVIRSACGTKLSCIGYSHISSDGQLMETGIWTWNNSETVPVLMGLDNEMSAQVDAKLAELDDILNVVVATTPYDLLITDPVETDANGKPIRMIRRAETNMGDLVADALREQTGADIAFTNGGGIRSNLPKGEITYGDIIKVMPFGNELTVVELTGQQILDALEWGARNVPSETGGFLQVSGLTYEIHVYIDNPCQTDANGMCIGFEGERRVKNVMVGGEPLDPEKIYTVASNSYILLEKGDGYTFFENATILEESNRIDNAVLIEYITKTLGGIISDDYADPYGQGRIIIVEEAPEGE